jgi:hypothetical protein
MTPSRQPNEQRFGLVLTNAVKLGGLVIAVHEALLVQQVRPIVLGVAALMLAGAQSLEQALVAFFGGAKPSLPPRKEDE